MFKRKSRLRQYLCAICVTVMFLVAGTGCSHSHPQPPKLTGSPEALSVVAQLQAMSREMNGSVVPHSEVDTYETIQDQASYFAENVYWGEAPPEYFQNLPKSLSKEEAKSLALRKYVDQTLKSGIPTGTYREGRYGPGDHWRRANKEMFPEQVRFFNISGVVSVRRETVDGRELMVLKEEHDLGQGGVYRREYYLDPQEQLLPRRIVQRFLRGRPATRPVGDVTISEEYDRGFWHGGRVVRTYTIPAAAISLLDITHDMFDFETTIQAHVKRPDGGWYITQATTCFPFFHRTETFSAQGVSFFPPGRSACDGKVPNNVRANR